MFFFKSISRKLVFLPRVTKLQLTLFHVGADPWGLDLYVQFTSPVPFLKSHLLRALKTLHWRATFIAGVVF